MPNLHEGKVQATWIRIKKAAAVQEVTELA
jgi:hypothetical protein